MMISRFLRLSTRATSSSSSSFSALHRSLSSSSETDHQHDQNEIPHRVTKPYARAFIFPGQGTVRPMMGADLAREFKAAATVFERVDEALKQNLSKIMASGENLVNTENQQPALLTHSYAVISILQSELGLTPSPPDVYLGHSVGEYAALTAAGALELEDAARLLRARGKAMQKASNLSKESAGMTALIGVKDFKKIDEIVKQILTEKGGEGEGGGVLVISAINSEKQITLSGHTRLLEEASNIIKKQKLAGRAVTLVGNGAYHSEIMRPAFEDLSEALSAVKISSPLAPVISNVTAQPMQTPEQIRSLLAQQLTAPVQWLPSVKHVVDNMNVKNFIECGSGQILCGLVRSIDETVETKPLDSALDVIAYISEAQSESFAESLSW